MSNATAKFQVNFKTPAGTLVNVYADSVGEACAILEEYMSVGFSLIQAAEAITTGGIVAAAPAPTFAPAAPAAAPAAGATGWSPAAAAPAFGGPVPNCDHGEPMRHVPAGISKAGKPYKAFYACARPREQACAAKA